MTEMISPINLDQCKVPKFKVFVLEQYVLSSFVANIYLFKEIADLPLPNDCIAEIQRVD